MNTNSSETSVWSVGVSRRVITPPLHEVELCGFGYYLNRTGDRVGDDLNATAMVIQDQQGRSVALVAVDITACDAHFTSGVRELVAAQTDIQPEAICVNCSHSHNAPTAAFMRGAGEVHPGYVAQAIKKTAEAIITARKNIKPATLSVSATEVNDITFNRTRENGQVDNRLSVLRADLLDGKLLAVALNFHTHLNAHLDANPRAISRDLAGEVVDSIEQAYPGATALYFQGTCGDVMLRPEFTSTERSYEPGHAIARMALEELKRCRPVSGDSVMAVTQPVKLPTWRWDKQEIMRDRAEALHRSRTGDTKDWLNGIAKAIVTYPDRLPLRYEGSVEKAVAAVSRFVVEWTDEALSDFERRPEYLETEVQAIRIGDLWFAIHSTELFTSFGLEVRKRWSHNDLFMLGFSNDSAGYLPDAHDIEKQSYAAFQSPKFRGTFPYTKEAGPVMVEALLSVLQKTISG